MNHLISACRLPAAIFTLAALLTACSGGGGGGGPAGPAKLDVLLTDTPADDLLSFRATVNELHFEIQGGGESANLLAGSVNMDLLALQGTFAWVASLSLPPNTYTGVRLVFLPGSYVARKNDGNSVAVNSISNTVTLPFATPLVISGSGYKKVVADIDLASSLSGLVTVPPIDFDPEGHSSDDSSISSHALDEFKGTVSSSNSQAGTLLVDASIDDDGLVALGQVLVRVSPSTLLIQDNGAAFASSSTFFAALVASATHLEVHGSLVSGGVNATRIEIEDNVAGGGEDHLVKVSGLILATGTGSFDMSIGAVENGAAIVSAVNGGSIPVSLHVTYDSSTVFFGHQGTVTTSAALVIGAHAKAKFASFTNPPFLASRVEVEGDATEVENQGQITAITGLPSTLTVHLDATSPAVLSGQVSSSSTNVVISLGSGSIVLDTVGRPTIASSALQNGLHVGVKGSVSGSPGSPTISVSELEIHAGELSDAIVGSINMGGNSFTTTGVGVIEEPFGTGVGSGPQSVLLAPNCVFSGDTTTLSGCWQLFNGLTASHVLEVRIKGLSTGGTNVIRAYEIRARVQ